MNMKIIKQGVLPETIEKEQTCYKCKTVFSYTKSDLQYGDRPGEGSYVTCPLCETFIAAKDPSTYNLAEAYYNK